MYKLFARATVSSLLSGAVFLPVAHAQSIEGSVELDEIIVTATRREENIQDVPMSVTAFSSDFFKDTGITDFTEIDQYTPSLKITQGTDSRSTSVRIRGIGSVGTNSGIDPSVGIFIDNVYQGRAGMTISDLFDVERVEVLRGPQGTLYGKNTAAGAISIITKAPTTEFEAQVEAVYNNDERAELRGSVNIPFGNSGHATRLTAFGIDGDHLGDNKFNGDGVNDANKWGLKSRTLFDFDDLGEFLISLDYSHEDTDCCALAVIEYDGLSLLNVPLTNTPSAEYEARYAPDFNYTAFEDTQPEGSPPSANPFGNNYWFDAEVSNDVKVGGVAVEWNKDLESDHSLTFINAWRHYESDSAYDGDFTAYDLVVGSTDVDLDQFSTEFRIASPGGETLDYQVGVYGYYSDLDSTGKISQGANLTNAIPGFGFLFPNGSLNTDNNTYKTYSGAAFGQLTWNVSDQWSATLGARYTYEKKERDGTQRTEGYQPNPIFPDIIDLAPIAGPDIDFDQDRDDSDVSPMLNVRYFATDDLMTYASVSRGFKSGGFDQRRVPEGESGEFDEEKSTNYELGWKGTWIDRRLMVNGTLYYVDYDDFQAQSFDGSSIKVTNAGSVESYGVELEAMFAFTSNLTAGTAIGYNHAEYDDFDNGQCTVTDTVNQYYDNGGTVAPGLDGAPCIADLGGEDLDNTPEWTASSYLSYMKQITDNLVTITRIEHNYTDSFYLDQDLDSKLKNDSVHLVNLRFTLTNADNDWEATVWGTNVTDEEYYVVGIDIPTVGGYAGATAPDAVYGLTLRYNWY